MDAQEVWHTWRRILSDPKFSRTLFNGGVEALADEFSLTPAEREICLSYSRTPKQAEWFVTNYRYRLVSSVCYAVETCAPLTWRLLLSRGTDVRALAQEFLDAEGWVDRGPYVYSLCRAVLRYLRARFATDIPFLGDLVELESRAAELIQRLADTPLAPLSGATPPDFQVEGSEVRFRQAVRALVARTEHDVRPWLREPSQIGKLELSLNPQFLLIYLADARSRVKYVSVGRMGYELFSALSHPKTLAELCDSLTLADAQAREAAPAVLDRFIRMGAVTWERV